ncbi:MAG: DUF938 domain-containing protein [Pseudomonadota bacterium]
MQSQRRHSPAAERNRAPILEALHPLLPPSGTVLEVASGTGQHVAWFAAALPMLTWQPSDVDASGFSSIRDYTVDIGNVLAPIELDVIRSPWPLGRADAIYCANMIHIAPWAACEGLFAGAGSVLDAGSQLHLYGPFKRGGQHTADSNRAFDQNLRERDHRWGIRDLDAVAALADDAGLHHSRTADMPANNLLVSFTRR